jgi:predicted nucleic acid-binding protein
MKFVNTLDYHLARPYESVDSYARRKGLELAGHIKSIKKVYLDTNFWVDLCNVRLGRLANENHAKLLQILEDLVARRLIVCPISAATVVEIFRQADSKTLSVTVETVDKLSNGIAMLDNEERVRLELFHFVRQLSNGESALHSLDDLVWTKVAYVLGFSSPTLDILPEDVDIAVQKAFIDQMWGLSFADMLEVLGNNAASMPQMHDYSENLNRGKFAHLEDHSSFSDLFLVELVGVLDAYEPVIIDLMRHLFEANKEANHDPKEAASALANTIRERFRSNKITNELPSFRVYAGLHAAVRWDTKRKYKANDAHDFHHAVAAVPYCDFFLTERSLRHLVNDKNLQFPSFFRCRTFSDASEAISALTRLLRIS